jgi:hypothetical protein
MAITLPPPFLITVMSTSLTRPLMVTPEAKA